MSNTDSYSVPWGLKHNNISQNTTTFLRHIISQHWVSCTSGGTAGRQVMGRLLVLFPEILRLHVEVSLRGGSPSPVSECECCEVL